eukprot:1355043-Amphidinium_carterae.9
MIISARRLTHKHNFDFSSPLLDNKQRSLDRSKPVTPVILRKALVPNERFDLGSPTDAPSASLTENLCLPHPSKSQFTSPLSKTRQPLKCFAYAEALHSKTSLQSA